MSVWNRLFGASEPSRSERSPASNPLRVESLEAREVPALLVGGWGESSYQSAFEGRSSSSRLNHEA
jgi:hypothetical protein